MIALDRRASGHSQPAPAPAIAARSTVPADAPAARTFTLEGRVLAAETRAPVAGALVSISERQAGSGSGEARTDASGTFRVRGLDEFGSWRIEAQADEFAPCTRTYSTPGLLMRAAPDDPWRLIADDLVLERGVRMEGIVRAPDGTPVPDALLLLAHDSWSFDTFYPARSRAVGHTRTDGTFALEHIEPGGENEHLLYAVTTDAIGASYVRAMKGSAPVTGVLITLAPSAAVAITVNDGDGKPIAGATLVADPRFITLSDDSVTLGPDGSWTSRAPDREMALGPHAEIQRLFSAVTDASGQARLAHLPLPDRGHYNITALAEGYDFASADEIVLAPGEERAITLVVTPLATRAVRGRMHDRTGKPIAGQRIVLEQSAMMRAHDVFRATTDEQGRFDIAVRTRHREFVLMVHSDPYVVPSQRIQFEDGQTDLPVDLIAERAAPITGTVVDQHGAPVPFAHVGILKPGEQRPSTRRADGAGRFELKEAVEGEHRLGLWLPEPRQQGANAEY
ncbi:MAG: carboxypeptidase-like regulatory domain-containing protein, partial [Planctomycetota bacterium]